VITDLLKEVPQGEFQDLSEVARFVQRYETRTGNTLRITCSRRGTLKRYKCVEHIGCTFFMHFGTRRRDGVLMLKTMESKHLGPCRPARDLRNRRWKRRRKNLCQEYIQLTGKTHSKSICPADVIKTAATMGNEDVPYMAAYRDMKLNDRTAATTLKSSFRLIEPYVAKFQEENATATTRVD